MQSDNDDDQEEEEELDEDDLEDAEEVNLSGGGSGGGAAQREVQTEAVVSKHNAHCLDLCTRGRYVQQDEASLHLSVILGTGVCGNFTERGHWRSHSLTFLYISPKIPISHEDNIQRHKAAQVIS